MLNTNTNTGDAADKPQPHPQPPPLPPRPGAAPAILNAAPGFGQSFANPYGQSYVTPYGGMYSSPAGYSGFGGGFGYGGGGAYGSYGTTAPSSAESNFVRIAEEQSRGAFQSIEAVVNAFASVANMLSSTHNAVFSSFRAVIGVVEQMSLLRAQLGGFFFVTLVQWVRRMWRLFLVYVRLKPANYTASESVWTDISTGNPTPDQFLPGSTLKKSFNWAAGIFWLIALGGPYLIYKAVSQMVASVEESRKWATGEHEHYSAEAVYDFEATSASELSFQAKERLRVAPKTDQPQIRGWLLASSADGQRIGLVPINYVKLLSRHSSSPPTVNPFNNDGTSAVSSSTVLENAFRVPPG